jgi:hypothetical protein
MKNLASLANADATPTMEAFADFLIAEVFGGTLPKGMDLASFRKGVALGGSTRMDFQKSEAWKSDARNYLANVEANRAKVAEERVAKATAAKAKAEERERAAIAKLAAAVAAAKAKADALRADADADADADDADDVAA